MISLEMATRSKEILHFRWKPAIFKQWSYPKNADLQSLESPPQSHRLFEIVIWKSDNNHKSYHYDNGHKGCILVHPDKLNVLTSDEFRNLRGEVLVVAGDDTKLSKNHTFIDDLKARFRRILYEAKDVDDPNVETVPMGFHIAYLLRCGGYDHIDAQISTSDDKKHNLVCAAWGSKWADLDKTIDSRKSLDVFLKKSSWISREYWDPLIYFVNLSRCHFMLCPTGNGIQAPKLFEAMLCRTRPVVQRTPAFVDLVGQGFPLLIVDKWEDVTQELLHRELRDKTIEWSQVFHLMSLNGLEQSLLKKIHA